MIVTFILSLLLMIWVAVSLVQNPKLFTTAPKDIPGISFGHQWSTAGYQDFLKQNGWEIRHSREMQARIAIVCTECVRKGGHPDG